MEIHERGRRGGPRGELVRPVDHRADLPATPPWRSAAFIAVSVATVELLILLVVGIWLFGKFFSDEVEKATDPTTVARVAVERELKERGQLPQQQTEAKPEAKAILTRGETSVLVLNGNGISGAASDTATRVRGRDYLIAGTGNSARTDYPRSIVMYRPGYEREGRRLAKDFGIRRVVPLDGMRPGELQGAHVALVVGG
jgi:LytR cell envelope-related transcriptional attenuator